MKHNYTQDQINNNVQRQKKEIEGLGFAKYVKCEPNFDLTDLTLQEELSGMGNQLSRHRNTTKDDIDRVVASMESEFRYDADLPVAVKHPKTTQVVLFKGHHTVNAVKQRGFEEWPVIIVEIDGITLEEYCSLQGMETNIPTITTQEASNADITSSLVGMRNRLESATLQKYTPGFKYPRTYVNYVKSLRDLDKYGEPINEMPFPDEEDIEYVANAIKAYLESGRVAKITTAKFRTRVANQVANPDYQAEGFVSVTQAAVNKVLEADNFFCDQYGYGNKREGTGFPPNALSPSLMGFTRNFSSSGNDAGRRLETDCIQARMQKHDSIILAYGTHKDKKKYQSDEDGMALGAYTAYLNSRTATIRELVTDAFEQQDLFDKILTPEQYWDNGQRQIWLMSVTSRHNEYQNTAYEAGERSHVGDHFRVKWDYFTKEMQNKMMKAYNGINS